MMPDRISSFRMVRTVSEGEGGALLHAVSEKSGERVVVRIVSGAAATEELERRCLRAVTVARLLANPAVVRLVEAGRLPDGSVYQIQEQLLGETLAGRLAARRRLPVNELLRHGRQLATVLSAAHARGIVHRALRPESVQLVADPEAIGGERVKLNDWGLAAVPAQGSLPATAPPVPLDSPTYLAPEQCRAGAPAEPGHELRRGDGSREAVGDRIDVYALGVILFQMASGQPPFDGRPASEIIAMHLAALPPKLKPGSLGMPRGLPALVAAMLIKDAKARPTMREVEERLVKLVADQQLDPTLTPTTRGSIEELAQALPSTNVTVQLRLPSASSGSLLPGRWNLVVAFSLPLTIVIGLWWLFAPMAPIPASPAGEDSSIAWGPARPAARKSVEAPAGATGAGARTSQRSLVGIPALRDGSLARASQRSQVRYPPLRDGSLPRASVLSRLRYPPLRDGKAIAVPRGNRRRR
jgi:serine/threonine-protein kinase